MNDKKKERRKRKELWKEEDKEGHKLMGNIHFFLAFGEHNHTINKLISSPPLSSPCPDHRIAPY